MKQALTDLGFEEIDVWEADAAKLGAAPGSGVDRNCDLSKAIALSIMRWSGVRESAGA
jgi:hypothetical protein